MRNTQSSKRTKTILISILLLFTIIPLAVAEQELLKNTTYTEASTIELAEEDYLLSISSYNVTTIRLQQEDQEPLFMGEKDCKRFDNELLCYEKKISDTQVRLAIYNLDAKLEVSLELNETGELDIGTPLQGRVWANNTGAQTAEDVIIKLKIPENLTITDTEYCQENGTHLIWQGRIPQERESQCYFTARIDKPLEEKLQANITYQSYGKTYSEKTEEHELKAQMPFELDITAPVNLLEPQAAFTITFTARNTEEDKNLTLENIELHYGNYAEFLRANIASIRNRGEYAQIKNRELEYNDTLKGSITLRVPYFNLTDELTLKITYNLTDEQTRTFERKIPYTTLQKQLLLQINPETLIFEATTNPTINITVINPYEALTYKGYEATITSDLLKSPQQVRMPYQRARMLASIPLQIPDVQIQEKHLLHVTVRATTDQRQESTIEKTYTITYQPIQDITIEKIIGETQGEAAISVLVIATNNHQQPVQATFKETFDEGLFASGTTETTTKLYPEEPQELYRYDLIAPITDEKETYTSTTTYTYTYNGHDIQREEPLELQAERLIRQPTTTQNEEQTRNNTPNNTTQEEPKKKNEEQSTKLIYILGSALLLFLLLAGYLGWRWIHHHYVFTVQHNHIIKAYHDLIGSGVRLKKEEAELYEHHIKLIHHIAQLEEHIKAYEKKLPSEIADLKIQEQKMSKTKEYLMKKHQELTKILDKLRKKEETIIEKEKEIETILKEIREEEEKLKKDDEMLKEDLELIRHEKEKTEQDQEHNKNKQQNNIKAIKELKLKHINNLNEKMDILAQRRKDMKTYHERIQSDEELLQEEYEKVKADLKLSKEDLKEAEKVYKEASADTTKEHEAQTKK